MSHDERQWIQRVQWAAGGGRLRMPESRRLRLARNAKESDLRLRAARHRLDATQRRIAGPTVDAFRAILQGINRAADYASTEARVREVSEGE